MEKEPKELLLFQLGPVQEFIAQAETIGDLRVGSEMLSALTAAALREIPDFTTEAVFPAVKSDLDADLAGIPNRFLVFVPSGRGEELGRAAANAAQTALREMAETAFPKTDLQKDRHDAFIHQVEAFLQTTWAVLKHPNNMGADYKALGKLMALRRNVRAFNAWREEGSGAVKDFLSGRECALDVIDSYAPNRNSGRGAMNLIKKTRWTDTDRLEATELGPYLAVIALDGDRMGGALSGFATQDQHRAFSEKLATFAHSVQISPKDGTLIYAGGDDVLAVVRATRAIPLAREVAAKFKEKMGAEGLTASVGIAIGSAKAPLQDLIHEAHAAEGRAKHVYERDALAVSVLKRSGEILHWGCKWGSKAFDIYERLSGAKGDLSCFAYKLAGFLEPYDLASDTELDDAMREVVLVETLHALEQTEGANGVLDEKLLKGYLEEPGVKDCPKDYLGLFLCEAFINRPRGE